MILETIIETVGREVFEKGAEHLAGEKNKLNGLNNKSPDFIHGIPKIIDAAGLHIAEQMQLWQQLVVLLPCYATWMYAFTFYTEELSEELRPKFLQEIARILDYSSDAVASAAQYALWVDFFENSETVGLSWREISGNLRTDAGRMRLLDVTGPVPYELKADFYAQMAENESMQDRLIHAFLCCLREVYGKANREHMRHLMGKLSSRQAHEEYGAVMKALS